MTTFVLLKSLTVVEDFKSILKTLRTSLSMFCESIIPPRDSSKVNHEGRMGLFQTVYLLDAGVIITFITLYVR